MYPVFCYCTYLYTRFIFLLLKCLIQSGCAISSLWYNEHCFWLASITVFYNLHFSTVCSVSCCHAFMHIIEWEKENSKPKCGIVCFFFLFYRDVEGVEPTAQSERVYRPENYCWRQRVWSPPKCSSFLQLVFQGPGEKVCLRFPSHQLLIQSVLFIGRILSLFSLPLSLLQVFEDFGS